MTAHSAYRKVKDAPLPRVDVVLTLYERLTERVRQARELLETDPARARLVIDRCRLGVAALAGGMEPVEANLSFLRLYEFILHRLEIGTAAALIEIEGILRTLQEAFEEVRPRALEMERAGQLPASCGGAGLGLA